MSTQSSQQLPVSNSITRCLPKGKQEFPSLICLDQERRAATTGYSKFFQFKPSFPVVKENTEYLLIYHIHGRRTGLRSLKWLCLGYRLSMPTQMAETWAWKSKKHREAYLRSSAREQRCFQASVAGSLLSLISGYTSALDVLLQKWQICSIITGSPHLT